MTEPYCKMVSKELQYSYSKGKVPRLCVKSFSSCFWDIGHRASSSDWNSFTVCAPCAAQAMSRFVCKKARP